MGLSNLANEAQGGYTGGIAVRAILNVQLVGGGDVGPNLVKALDGFDTSVFDHGQTRVTGRVGGQATIYDLLAFLNDSNIEFVALNSVTGEQVGW